MVNDVKLNQFQTYIQKQPHKPVALYCEVVKWQLYSGSQDPYIVSSATRNWTVPIAQLARCVAVHSTNPGCRITPPPGVVASPATTRHWP